MGQDEFLFFTVRQLESLALPYMLVGSYASGIHGETRQTHDIDIVVELFTFQVESFCAAFPAPDYYVSPDAVRDAIRNRFQFNVIHSESGSKADFIFSRRDEWGKNQLSRRQRVQLAPDVKSYVASPVDVIVGKMWYYSEGQSEKHLRDIVSILKTSGRTFNFDEVAKWAGKLGYTAIWEKCLNDYAQSQSAKE